MHIIDRVGLKPLSSGVVSRQFASIEGEVERVVIQRPLDNEVIKHRKPLTYYRQTFTVQFLLATV